jgi:DtxR family transcriptional regulator, Mn-dependent transcriptional regulator
MTVTDVARDYLLAIYALTEEGKPVIGARLAERLRVTAPTVTQTLRRLERDGLIYVEPRRGIVLTEAGQAVAVEAMRRQWLSERWLVDILGVDWSEAHAAARAMEGAITPRIAARMEAILGHPTPYPRAEAVPPPGTVPLVPGVVPLGQIRPGEVVILDRVADEDEHASELLAYLDRQGLRPNVRLTVMAVEPWAQTITVQYGEQQIVLGAQAADRVWVRRLTPEEAARANAGLTSECPDEESVFVAEVQAVESPCPAGHRLGDRFVFGQRTPCGMCGEAYVEMYPHLQSLRERAASRRGEQVAVACPEHGNVTFQVRLSSTIAANATP